MASPLIVRPVRREDRPDWLRMRVALWPGSPAREHDGEIEAFLEGDRARAEVFVAEAGPGELVGFAEASLRSHAEGCTGSPVAYLEGWWVSEARRRTGVGAALVEAVERWALRQGVRELASDAELDNEDSQAAHRALGFGEAGRIVCFAKPLR